MASDSEPAKLLLPFLQRADELQKHEPLVAYYCRLFAMEKGLKIPQKERTKTTNAILISLMNQLEKDKKSIKIGQEDYLYVEGFATNVFAKADKQDRAGRADLNTAKTFYAASIFFEILNQFGELQPDIEQKLKYAVWKAADIRKAIKEGRNPEPGPPGGDKDLSVPSSSPASSHDLGPSESFFSSQPVAGTPTHHVEKDFTRNESSLSSYRGSDPSPPPSDYNPPDISNHPHHYPTDQHPISQNIHYQENPSPPPPYSYPNFQSFPIFHDSSLPATPTHQPISNYPSTPATMKYDYGSGGENNQVAYTYDINYLPPAEKITEAHKAARFAVGALAFDDVPVAVEFLRKSLELLTNPNAERHL